MSNGIQKKGKNMQKEILTSYRNRLEWIVFIFVALLNICAFFSRNFHFIIISIVILWMLGIIYSCLNFKQYILFFWFQITIGVFILVRPLLLTLQGKTWWKNSQIDENNFYIATLIIFLSVLSLNVGARLFVLISERRKETVILTTSIDEKRKENFMNYLQVISMLMFYITAVFFCIEGLEKVLYVQKHSYLEFYSDFNSKLPWFVSTIGSMMKYSLCVFLSTKPRKRRAFFVLTIFELSALFDLIIGVRGSIMLNSIFILVYYLIRDYTDGEEKWFGKIEGGLVVIGTPLALAFMTAYSFIRSGQRVLDFNIFRMIRDFFFGQGVTFEVVARGVSVIDQLPQRPGRNYTFGQFIDYIVHGRLGQLLFGTEALPVGNNIINGTQSNSLSHNLAYITKGEAYLRGEGWGSSYVLENYIDFGYFGVILFGLFLGALLIWMMYYWGRHALTDTVILVSLLTIFYIPRAESTSWIMFIITLQFWFCVGCCWLGAFISVKVSVFQKIYSHLKLMPIPLTDSEKNRKHLTIFKSRKVAIVSIVILSLAVVGGAGAGYIMSKNQLEGIIEASVQTAGAEYEGRRVTLSVEMEEKGEYLYQFSETYNGKENIVQEFSTDNQYVFVTEKIGNHTFYVDVKDNKGRKSTFMYHLEVKKYPTE